jgi:hypothetical protein
VTQGPQPAHEGQLGLGVELRLRLIARVCVDDRIQWTEYSGDSKTSTLDGLHICSDRIRILAASDLVDRVGAQECGEFRGVAYDVLARREKQTAWLQNSGALPQQRTQVGGVMKYLPCVDHVGASVR